jgi:lipopolysaccharide export system protein LptA
MQYWYSAQLRQYRLQFIRAFSGFSVKTGRGGPNNTEELLKVPCRYGDPSRVAATIVRGNTENKVLTVPFITCYINSLVMSASRRQDPYFQRSVQVNERQYDEQTQRYTNDIGNRYRVDMYMPVPYDVTMQVDIWTNNEDIKEQLLEQIMVLYNPTINIQTSNNPIDWTVLSYIEMMENVNWSSRTIPVGTDNPIDVATIQFKFPIWINPPAKVKKQVLIEEIITNIVKGYKEPNAVEWSEYEFLARDIVTPDNAEIRVTNVNPTTYALSLCQENGSQVDPESSPTVTFATAYPRLFSGMVFIWNGIQITITTTSVTEAISQIRSFLGGTQLNCVIYNNTTMQFINTAAGDNIFADVVPGSLAALGLEATTYPGGNLAWWRLLQYYGTIKPYSQYGVNASQIRLKTVDDLTQTSSDLVGWIEIDPTDQNILYWIAESDSFPATTLPPINAIVDPTVSGPGINLPLAVNGQRYLLTENLPITSQAWGNISIPRSSPVAVQSAIWQAGQTKIQLNAANTAIQSGQLIVSSNVGIPQGTVVLSVDNTNIEIVNETTPLSSNITVTNSNYAPVYFYSQATANDIITYNGTTWIMTFDSQAERNTTQYVLNQTSNRLYAWSNGYWAPVVDSKYTRGYWTIAL